MPMYVRRDYSQPFFTKRKKRPYRRWLVMLILTIGVMYPGYLIASQPAQFIAMAATMFASTTPTPLPGSLVTRANDLYLSGDLEGAAALYEQAIAQRPQNIDYLYEYGQLVIDMDRPEPALEIGERISEMNPGDPRGMTLRTRALVWMEQYSSAIPIGLSGLQIDPNFAPLYEALSRAYTGNSQWAEGLDYGRRAVDLAPDDVRARWAYANALMAVGARDEAVIELENAISLQPAFLPPYFELAYLYLSVDRDQEAIDIYNTVLAMQPRNARAMLRLCEAYRKVGEFERALGMCQDAVTTDPTFARAQYRLGILRYNRREFAAARDAFQACVNLEPESLECSFRLGLSHYYLAQTTYQHCLNTGGANCDVRAECELAWHLLEAALLRSQLEDGLSETTGIITEGLRALAADAACPGFAGRAPEITPEPESS